uniref:DUF1778 domain-containing protein n=1 Tax=Mycobacterium riyadhense TaxID=486698 RepID=A0A653F1G1_9MYCO|nr:hypothetical protein BIN_B_04742 [Mycobacterium riyadhense]
MDPKWRRRDRRMELRTTAEERELIDRAVTASGTDLTNFVITHASEAARRLLADRDHFQPDAAAAKEWEDVNALPARELADLSKHRRPAPRATSGGRSSSVPADIDLQ